MSDSRRSNSWAKGLQWMGRSARNAAEILRRGRLGAPWRAPHQVVHHDAHWRLRRYARDAATARDDLQPLLLVPPLMVTSEVYDISPELSAVAWLAERGVDVWLVDFGAPEVEEGGLDRTLDDHVLAVSDAVDRVHAMTGHDVHLGGYSQGGMFCYQAAAYRESRHLASIITFGSPVDIHRNLPVPLHDDIAGRLIQVAQKAVAAPLEQMASLPGTMSSTAFKLLGARKEVQQVVDFVSKLHDRDALEARESRRRFLGGEGFVAWPGPALRTFVDEFIVNNRMASGGFVIDGRTVTLADVTCPVLYFVGTRDELARPAGVRAVREAVASESVHEVELVAGHFGLVVGSRSLAITWPTVAQWIDWLDADGPRPDTLPETPVAPEPEALESPEEAGFDQLTDDIELFYDVATDMVDLVWNRLGDVSREVGGLVDSLRWQLPRFARLKRLGTDEPISVGLALAEQAAAIPNQTFFLYQGRAFSWADADRRVSYVVRGLWACGVRPGHRVAIVMVNRPSYLTLVAALSRLGAVSVLLGHEMPGLDIAEALAVASVDHVVAEPERAARVREAFDGQVLVLGGGGASRTLVDGVVDMEAIDPEEVELPDDFVPNPGRGSDLAMVVFTVDADGDARPARITNRRWALAALGTAAAAALSSHDTVYNALPVSHPSGMLIAVSGALVGGARLALARRFTTEAFLQDIRRYGATVAFYAGDMCRALVDAPPDDGPRPQLRLFVGHGMRPDVHERLLDRFDAGVLDFFASTESPAALANLGGRKIGSVGRRLQGSTRIELMRYDFTGRDLVRDADGRGVPCGAHEPGLLVAKVDASRASASYEGFVGAPDDERVVSGLFEAGDAWYDTGQILERDEDGDYWPFDPLRAVAVVSGRPVSTWRVEDAMRRVPGVQNAVAWAEPRRDGGDVVVAAARLAGGASIDAQALNDVVLARRDLRTAPTFVRLVDRIPMTAGFRPVRSVVRAEGVTSVDGPVWWLDPRREHYVRLDGRNRPRARRESGLADDR